jgi:hypothetical protein
MWRNICDERCATKGGQLWMQQCAVIENWPTQKITSRG